jgi:hypothetical protein
VFGSGVYSCPLRISNTRVYCKFHVPRIAWEKDLLLPLSKRCPFSDHYYLIMRDSALYNRLAVTRLSATTEVVLKFIVHSKTRSPKQERHAQQQIERTKTQNITITAPFRLPALVNVSPIVASTTAFIITEQPARSFLLLPKAHNRLFRSIK